MRISPYETYYWNAFLNAIKNEYGVAGLMGNLQAESYLIPYIRQGDTNDLQYKKSLVYTQNVNNGVISKYTFVHDSVGYGLAQWTYHTRKEGLYNMYKTGYPSIGDAKLSVDYLLYELQNSYKSVWNTLISATSIRQASDAVLHDFENPKDQSEKVEELRASYAQEIYNRHADTPIPPGPPVPPDPPHPVINTDFGKLPIWFYVLKPTLNRKEIRHGKK